MPAIGPNRRWLPLLALVAACLARADEPPNLTALFASMASALSDANPGEFLRAVDPGLPGYQRLASNVRALATENAVANTVVISSQKGDARVQEVELDWQLEIKGIGQSGVFVQRKATVKCRLERQKKKWRIVSLDPAAFFAPPGAEGDH